MSCPSEKMMNLGQPRIFCTILPLLTTAEVPFSNMVIHIITLLILLLLAALTSGSESAFFSIGPKEKEGLNSEDSKSAKQVLKYLENPKELLAILLIVNTFVFVAIAIISSTLIELFIGHVNDGNKLLRFFFEVLGITLTLLLLGEVIPKIYSSRNSVRMAKIMALPIKSLGLIPPVHWLTKVLVNSTSLMNKRTKKRSIKITTDELEQALALTKEDHTSEEEQKLLEGIVKFGNTEACQIMRSRIDMVAVNEDKSFTEVLELIMNAGYSRIPVYTNSIDQVNGILYIKDLLSHLNDKNLDWRKLIRKPFFIPENKKIDDLLKDFQDKKMHMAVVVDEYGGAAGIVTLEDVLEEIVGDITDEFDEEETVYTRIDNRTFLFEGKTTLVDFYKSINVDSKIFESHKGDSESIGGFIIERAGKILRNNEYIICDGIKLIVESSDKRRIKMVKVILPEEKPTV
jgi:putative hemolysin